MDSKNNRICQKIKNNYFFFKPDLYKKIIKFKGYMFLIFDTETTGLPKRWDAPISDVNNWPRVVQLAWQLHEDNGVLFSNKSYLIKPTDFDIPFESEKVHGISTMLAFQYGMDIQTVLDKFLKDLKSCEYIVGHNLKFDINAVSYTHLTLPTIDPV